LRHLSGSQNLGHDATARLRCLREWHADFAFKVSVKYTEIVQKSRKSGKDFYLAAYEDLPNACVFHEHLVLGKDACRERIKNKVHIFAEMIEACAKDGISMVKEMEGN
jgi:hypothetical protein